MGPPSAVYIVDAVFQQDVAAPCSRMVAGQPIPVSSQLSHRTRCAGAVLQSRLNARLASQRDQRMKLQGVKHRVSRAQHPVERPQSTT